MCQTEVKADGSMADAVAVVDHNARSLKEQLAKATLLARARSERLFARDFEILEGQLDGLIAATGVLFGAVARRGERS